jgi:O-antigen/teichoic acid export membrane protein
MAVVTKEKVLHTQPLLILQVVVNLILDYTLIRRYGMNGGVAAVLGTFLLTIPVRLYVVAKLIGGVYFPMRFFLKVAVSVFVLATVLSPLAPNLGLIGLFAVGLVYGAAYLAAIRFLRLIQERDITELRNLGFGKLNRILDLLVGSAHA